MNIQPTLDRSNNFNFRRLFFAGLVIILHLFPLTNKSEFYEVLTNGQFSLGSLSVDCFFVMSGYLIMTACNEAKLPKIISGKTWSLINYSVLLSFVFVYFSWHLVEKKDLKFKNLIK